MGTVEGSNGKATELLDREHFESREKCSLGHLVVTEKIGGAYLRFAEDTRGVGGNAANCFTVSS